VSATDAGECLRAFVEEVARSVAEREAERALLLAEGYCPVCKRRVAKSVEELRDLGGTFLVYRCPEHGLILAIRVGGE